MRLTTLLPLVGSGILVTACGPMPGYRPPEPPSENDGRRNMPRGGPADAPPADDNDEAGWDGDDDGGEAYTTPPEKRPPPPVYRPPEPEPTVAAPTPSTVAPPPVPLPPVAPPTASPSPVRVIEVDKDSAYIIDDARGLCFFRFRESLAPIDCSRIADTARPATPVPAPQTAPVPQPAAPTPAPTAPGAFRPDELDRFQKAFNQIFCDRVAKSNTPPETRIRDAGLDLKRYEAIETWMADDDKRWWDVTDKARQSCPANR